MSLTRRTLVVATAGLGAAACNPIGDLAPPAPDLYFLSPVRIDASGLAAAPGPLIIDRPLAPASVDTARIALVSAPRRLEFFAGVNWIDNAPAVVHDLMIESFDLTGKATPIARDTTGLRARFTLRPELRRFHARYDGSLERAPLAEVTLRLRLTDLARREIVATTGFAAEVPAASARFRDIIGAFDAALGDVLSRTVTWTLEEIAIAVEG